MNYETPAFQKEAFTCPRCGVLAKQDWHLLWYDSENYLNKLIEQAVGFLDTRSHRYSRHYSDPLELSRSVLELNSKLIPVEEEKPLSVAFCQHCRRFTLWLGERMLYPQTGEAPPPHPDMPPAIRELYEEARGVLPASSRASAALLRVALEGLLEEAGYEKGSLADRLKRAHEEGKLNAKIYELAEALRLAGNAAAHYEPWKIDPSQGQEDREIILALFEFLNEVTEELIAKPKRLEEMKQKLSGRLREEGP